MIRPFGFFAAIRYAGRAAIAHYRFARTTHRDDVFPDGIGLVVTSREPTQSEMDTAGSRWSDWSRMQGAQPLDPEVIWRDVAILWTALHAARRRSA